jgi:hypothetical protein
MTAKQITGPLAPDGSTYITLTDGAGNLIAAVTGTVTAVSFVNANGVSGAVATPSTTPAITLSLGDINPTSVSTTGMVSASTLTISGNANVGTVTTGTWSATAITATSLSGTTLAGGILVSSLTSVGVITALTASTISVSNTLTGAGSLNLGGNLTATGNITGNNFSATGNVSGNTSNFNSVTGTFSPLTALPTFTTTAGGVTTAALKAGTVGIGMFWGSGAPSISAVQGSIYLRTDGSTVSTRMYVNTTGASTWTAVTTLA